MTLTPTAPAGPAPGASVRAALATGARPPAPGSLSTSLTFAWRALLKIRHVPEQLSDVIAVPIIFTLMFTYLFGGALDGSPRAYLQFLLPGTLVMAVLLATVYTGVNLNTDLGKGVFDRFRALPIWRPAPIAGALIGDALRYLLACALVLALGLLLGFRPHGGALGVLLAVALVVVFALALSWVFTLLGLLLRSPNAIMSVAMVVLFPLTLASNILVEPDTMPGWLHTVVDANPVTHLVTTARAAMAGSATAGQITAVLLASAVIAAVFAPLTVRLYNAK
ncbi:ABC transporter permease [Actinocrinis puniceicyclus]|uniref:Transport permease protein n=1 Tax=Actinocrinis puniceicyclus TaxID=977794 RepID=A0A8J7WPX9_9ACTN|nr:ABC transporter permease [Actinocrinis puniceicyclus]MBS2966356.1 ABC transporter permease [Actinocrinis puniceicyclus]